MQSQAPKIFLCSQPPEVEKPESMEGFHSSPPSRVLQPLFSMKFLHPLRCWGPGIPYHTASPMTLHMVPHTPHCHHPLGLELLPFQTLTPGRKYRTEKRKQLPKDRWWAEVRKAPTQIRSQIADRQGRELTGDGSKGGRQRLWPMRAKPQDLLVLMQSHILRNVWS